MQVILNGAEESVAATTLAELCIEKMYSTQNLVVELNDAIVSNQSDFGKIGLRERDRINLFRIVAGG